MSLMIQGAKSLQHKNKDGSHIDINIIVDGPKIVSIGYGLDPEANNVDMALGFLPK